MGCLYTTLRPNPKYKANKKNGGKIPTPKDMRITWIPTPCGRCKECKATKVREWKQRLEWEIKDQYKLKIKGNFVTMTFTNESLVILEDRVNGKITKLIDKKQEEEAKIKQKTKLSGYNLDNEIAIEAVKVWRERYRQMQRNKPKKERHTLRYWAITEISEVKSERLHIHAVVWSNNQEEILKAWKWGKIDIGAEDHNGKITNYVNNESIGYITKYYTKPNKKHKYYLPKVLTSQGMGEGYQKSINAQNNKFNGAETKLTTRNNKGFIQYIGKYQKDKLYSDDEKEMLNIYNLDKHIQYIGKIKIDTSTDEGKKEYEKILKEERAKAKRHGHSDNTIDKNQKYEADKRRNQLSYIRKKIVKGKKK